MIIGSVLFVHAMAAFLGVRMLRRKQKAKEAVLLLILAAVSAYAALADQLSLPAMSIPGAIRFIFQPYETWFETVLGGPFG
ncbi:hypothetical protein SD70_10190 [Gordoniibacillus kamchatkensis]|uniref:Uncharacterized protein n=1 Tax=Gordoniibacillus kamchatkensis TaxID=1590651 RepID=A0ABR5AIX4_9BACL|nr:hypothetical protein [Paenibacillus sp. VKM B-2647]KIL40981.1 hypothetical protein SD70_10190 [Paenibacillus sp. VKM B-2647]